MSHFGLNLGQTAEDSEMFTNIWLRSIGLIGPNSCASGKVVNNVNGLHDSLE